MGLVSRCLSIDGSTLSTLHSRPLTESESDVWSLGSDDRLTMDTGLQGLAPGVTESREGIGQVRYMLHSYWLSHELSDRSSQGGKNLNSRSRHSGHHILMTMVKCRVPDEPLVPGRVMTPSPAPVIADNCHAGTCHVLSRIVTCHM